MNDTIIINKINEKKKDTLSICILFGITKPVKRSFDDNDLKKDPQKRC